MQRGCIALFTTSPLIRWLSNKCPLQTRAARHKSEESLRELQLAHGKLESVAAKLKSAQEAAARELAEQARRWLGSLP